MVRFIAPAVLCASLTVLSFAQDTKWEPPATPAGWKAITSKDGVYRFIVPQDTQRSGSRDRTVTARRIKTRNQINYYTLKDGTVLTVQAATMTGAGLKGVKVSDVYNILLSDEKDDGFQISNPKSVMVGPIKAREYRLSKANTSRRMVLFYIKPRIFMLDVSTTDPAKLETETTNTFLQSLVIVPLSARQAAAKETVLKDEQAGKNNLAKYGAKWTMNLKEMTPPDAPAAGLIRGREFKPDTVTFQGGQLVFRQGKAFFADVEVALPLFLKANEPIENKTYNITPAAFNPVGSPHVRLATMAKNAKVPRSEGFVSKYALRLTFGAKDATGAIPGTIYLCTPDAAKSFLAGKFTATVK